MSTWKEKLSHKNGSALVLGSGLLLVSELSRVPSFVDVDCHQPCHGGISRER